MDSEIRIYELARTLKVPNQEVVSGLRELGYDVKSHSSRIDKMAADLLIAYFEKKNQQVQANYQRRRPGGAATKMPRPGGADTKKQQPGKRFKRPPFNDDDDFGWLHSSAVPKKPYPGDDDTSIRLPLPKDDVDEIP